jgi:predicted RNase H-like HicB family nuclease
MNNAYTAVIKQDGGWWIGWVEEVPGVNCQEKTREELIETIKVTLREALDFNRLEALAAAGMNYQEEKIAV